MLTGAFLKAAERILFPAVSRRYKRERGKMGQWGKTRFFYHFQMPRFAPSVYRLGSSEPFCHNDPIKGYEKIPFAQD